MVTLIVKSSCILKVFPLLKKKIHYTDLGLDIYTRSKPNHGFTQAVGLSDSL